MEHSGTGEVRFLDGSILYYGAMLCERVTVTVGDHRLSLQFMNISLHYTTVNIDMESPICTRSLSSRNHCPACVHVTRQLSFEEWYIVVDP